MSNPTSQFPHSDFKLIINSNNYTGVKTTNSNVNYQFDFTPFDDGLYELSFSFASNTNNENIGGVAEILINFFDTQCFTTSPLTIATPNTTHIGVVYPQITSGTNGYLCAKFSDNSPTLIRKPMSNLFTVQVLNLAGGLYVDGVGAALNSYILALAFKKVADI
jgi:hypothetical protein